jgi:ArsR family transcriptional regulator, arsenate/arsenite/antimonite-responsive transcriptional repressor
MSSALPMASCCTTPAPRLRGAGDLAALCRALSDETRLRILALLRDGEICVCHIHGGLRLPQPTISRHLAYLRKAGLVEARRQGIWMYYRLAVLHSPVINEVLHAALHALTHADVTASDAVRLRKELAAS